MTASRLPPIALLLCVAGCGMAREAYYNAWEKAGYAKRERLVDNVKAARDEQDKAKTTFGSALTEFKQLSGFKGGDLEAVYDKLKGQYDDCGTQADAVRGRIKSVRNVGDTLFDEWDDEIGQIQDSDLRKQSQSLYDRTQTDYKALLKRMDAAAASMDPVLSRFKDRVLYLKSNLNAQAIGSLADVEGKLGHDIDQLIERMQASIAEADQFMAKLSKGT